MYQDELLDKIILNQNGLVMKKPFHLLDMFALENKDNKISIPDAFEIFNQYLAELFDYLILEASSGGDLLELLKEYKDFITNADEILLSLIMQDEELAKEAKAEAKEQDLTIRQWLAKNSSRFGDNFGTMLEEYQYEIYRK